MAVKVAIAGSRALPPGLAPRLLVRFLAKLPEDATILLRRPFWIETAKPGQFELDVERVCTILHLRVEWRIPNPEETPGRASVFVRDIEMVEHADLLLAFFLKEDWMSSSSGTTHLVEKALESDTAVYAYKVDGDVVDLVGEHDPDGGWWKFFE